jgi:hypothetical protein
MTVGLYGEFFDKEKEMYDVNGNVSAKLTGMAHFLSITSIVNSYFTILIKEHALCNKIYTVPLTR